MPAGAANECRQGELVSADEALGYFYGYGHGFGFIPGLQPTCEIISLSYASESYACVC